MSPQLCSEFCLLLHCTEKFLCKEWLTFLPLRKINSFSLLMRFHLLIWPSTLKVILITIFKNQSNCVIKVKKKFFFLNQRFNLGFYNVLLWLLKWGWVTPLPSFSMFSWIPLRCFLSSVHPPQITQIKLYDTRYSTESKGAPTQPPSPSLLRYPVNAREPGGAPSAVCVWESTRGPFLCVLLLSSGALRQLQQSPGVPLPATPSRARLGGAGRGGRLEASRPWLRS